MKILTKLLPLSLACSCAILAACSSTQDKEQVAVKHTTMTPSQITNPLATHGIVTSPNYLATQAGLDVLRRGGTAVDAAIATAEVKQAERGTTRKVDNSVTDDQKKNILSQLAV